MGSANLKCLLGYKPFRYSVVDSRYKLVDGA